MPLDPEDLDLLSSYALIRNFDKKVIIVYEGEVEEYVNFVASGLVRKYFMREEEEVVLQIAREGELISASDSFLSQRGSVYCTETIEPTTFISFSRSQIDELFARDVKWQCLAPLLMSHLLIEKEYWELDRIRLTTQERFLKFTNQNPDLLSRVPQKYLASFLGIQPETFSRLKNLYKDSLATP